MKRAVVIVAGGKGARMGGNLPKQYMEIAGRPMIVHTIHRFRQFDPAIRVVTVVAGGHLSFWEMASRYLPRGAEVEIAAGGSTRTRSVSNGLERIGEGEVVGIHDAVRPLVSLETLGRCYRAAEETGSGIPVMEMHDSVRKVAGDGSSTQLDRTRLKRVQTPQVFRAGLIREAYRRMPGRSFTDDASLFEAVHGRVTLVEGNPENIKITTPADLSLAGLIISSRMDDIR